MKIILLNFMKMTAYFILFFFDRNRKPYFENLNRHRSLSERQTICMHLTCAILNTKFVWSWWKNAKLWIIYT